MNILGDTNGDGTINITDAVQTLQIVAGIYIPTENIIFRRANVSIMEMQHHKQKLLLQML